MDKTSDMSINKLKNDTDSNKEDQEDVIKFQMSGEILLKLEFLFRLSLSFKGPLCNIEKGSIDMKWKMETWKLKIEFIRKQ